MQETRHPTVPRNCTANRLGAQAVCLRHCLLAVCKSCRPFVNVWMSPLAQFDVSPEPLTTCRHILQSPDWVALLQLWQAETEPWPAREKRDQSCSEWTNLLSPDQRVVVKRKIEIGPARAAQTHQRQTPIKIAASRGLPRLGRSRFCGPRRASKNPDRCRLTRWEDRCRTEFITGLLIIALKGTGAGRVELTGARCIYVGQRGRGNTVRWMRRRHS